MLSDLPSEIIYQIALHLPSARSLASLSQTCRRLHDIVTAEDSRILRAFVKSRFPLVKTPPFWKDAAMALTARSRALDRHSFIGRFVLPSENAKKVGSHQATRNDNPTHGYRPSIDSYEVWNGDKWADRKEVLVWGAADELVMRIRQTGTHRYDQWLVFNDLNHISSYDDICGVHLLKPGNDFYEEGNEHLIFGRISGELAHLSISPDDGSHEYKQRFKTQGSKLERIDLSGGLKPILAAHFLNGSIALYQTAVEDSEVEPFAHIQNHGLARSRYSKFLSPSLITNATGRLDNTLSVSSITQDQVSVVREIGVDSLDFEANISTVAKANINGIASLNGQMVGGNSGQVFLAAWGDRAIRLHDLRSHEPYEFTYRDTTDHNPVYSLLPFSHDRFLVGAGGDAVLKIFDLRMPRSYSYLDANGPCVTYHAAKEPPKTLKDRGVHSYRHNSAAYPRKDFSMFLSHKPPGSSQPNRGRGRGNRSYRGAIYDMSTPSLSSPTVYTGIENGVFRLDFVSTDDLHGTSINRPFNRDRLDISEATLMSPDLPDSVVNLSGYERPEPEDLTATSKLRIQMSFGTVQNQDMWTELVTGWDRRWVRLDEEAAWRRRH